MREDLYNDTDGDAEMMGSTPDKEPREEMDERDEATALIPKSVTGGKHFEPGDRIVLSVVAVQEDELVVKYATEKEEKGESESEEEPSMSRAMMKNEHGMDSMYG